MRPQGVTDATTGNNKMSTSANTPTSRSLHPVQESVTSDHVSLLVFLVGFRSRWVD